MTACQPTSAPTARPRLHDEADGCPPCAGPIDIVEIHPLLHLTVAATRPSWQDHAEVAFRLDARATCVRVDAQLLTRTCSRIVLDVVSVIRERDGGQPAGRGRLVVATRRSARRVDVSVETEGFRHVLRLPAVD